MDKILLIAKIAVMVIEWIYKWVRKNAKICVIGSTAWDSFVTAHDDTFLLVLGMGKGNKPFSGMAGSTEFAALAELNKGKKCIVVSLTIDAEVEKDIESIGSQFKGEITNGEK